MNKQEKNIIFAMMVVFALLLGALVVVPAAVGNRTVTGEFVAPDFDPAAVSGIPQITEAERQFSWLQMGEHIRLALCGSPLVTDGGVELYVTSDSTNTAWLLVKVFDQSGDELGRSGLIRPGEYVQTVALDASAVPGTVVTVKILSYEPETYYSLGSASAQLLLAGDE